MRITVVLLLVCACLFPSSSVVAQELPYEREHVFWDQTNIILHSAVATVAATDFWTTRRVMSRGGTELNPLARPFASSDGTFAAFKMGNVATCVGLSYVLHRRGWHRWERLLPAVAIASDGIATSLNLRVRF